MSGEKGVLSALDQAASVQALKLKVRQAIADASPGDLTPSLEALLPLLDPDTASAIVRAAQAWEGALQGCPPTQAHIGDAPPGESK